MLSVRPGVYPVAGRLWRVAAAPRQHPGMTVNQLTARRLDLACEIAEVPHGLRLLCPDGRSFLLRGVPREALARGALPEQVLQVLSQLGVLRPARASSVAVVGSGPLAADVCEAIRAVPGALVVEMGDGLGRPRPGGHWSLLGESGSRLRPDLVVVCPRDPLGLREPVHLCQDRGVPVVLAWAGPCGAWLGPVSLAGRPGCQDCLDIAMARRDPLWPHTAVALIGSAPGWAPRRWLAESLRQMVDEGAGCENWQAPSWGSWTVREAGFTQLDAEPGCRRCRDRRGRAA